MALNAVVDPRYIQPRTAMMVDTQSWAFTGQLNRWLILDQLDAVSYAVRIRLRTHILEKGRPSSLAKAQKTRPVPK